MNFDDKEKQMDHYDDSILIFMCKELELIDVNTRQELRFTLDKGTIEKAAGMKDFSKIGRIRIKIENQVFEFSKVREENLQSNQV